MENWRATLLFFFDLGVGRVALERLNPGQATGLFSIGLAGAGDVLAVAGFQTPEEFTRFVFVNLESGRRFGLTLIGGAGRRCGEICGVADRKTRCGDGNQQNPPGMRHHGILLSVRLPNGERTDRRDKGCASRGRGKVVVKRLGMPSYQEKGTPMAREVVVYIHGVTPKGQYSHQGQYAALHEG